MNKIPSAQPGSQSVQTAPPDAAGNLQSKILSAADAGKSSVFAGSAHLSTSGLVTHTLTLPPIRFSSSFETHRQSGRSTETDVYLPPPRMTEHQEITHTLTPAEKQIVMPANHAPADWLSSDFNPMSMGPSDQLVDSHFLDEGSARSVTRLSPKNLRTFEKIRDSYTTETQTIKVKDKNDPTKERSVDITVRKFNRPDPRSYLSPTAIENHLAAFRQEPCLFITRSLFDKFCSNGIGRPDGQFLVSKEIGDKIENLLSRKSTFSAGEAELGLPSGCWSGQEILRVTVNNIPNLRMASGNEAGANKFWMPGGFLPNGLKEAVCDQLSLDSVSKKSIIPEDDLTV